MTVAQSYGPGWHLPTKDELNVLYLNQNVVGGFAVNLYWSSTEYDRYDAWFQIFFNGHQSNYYKTYANIRVRAVRAF
jgi:hypothetical protein